MNRKKNFAVPERITDLSGGWILGKADDKTQDYPF